MTVIAQHLTMTAEEAEDRHYRRSIERMLDPDLTISQIWAAREEQWVLSQAATGSWMIRQIEKMILHWEEHHMEPLEELDCGHPCALDGGITYRGVRLILCEDCKKLIAWEMREQMAPFVDGQKLPTASQMNVLMATANPGGHGQIAVPVEMRPQVVRWTSNSPRLWNMPGGSGSLAGKSEPSTEQEGSDNGSSTAPS